jgi:hypothetical protein
MATRYEIKENNIVEIFYDEATVPSLRQPKWPNGETWSDTAEATAWAELYIASINDETAPFAPNARGEEGRAKPTAKQKAERDAARKAVEDATTPEDRKAAQEALRALFN